MHPTLPAPSFPMPMHLLPLYYLDLSVQVQRSLMCPCCIPLISLAYSSSRDSPCVLPFVTLPHSCSISLNYSNFIFHSINISHGAMPSPYVSVCHCHMMSSVLVPRGISILLWFHQSSWCHIGPSIIIVYQSVKEVSVLGIEPQPQDPQSSLLPLFH